MIPLSRSTEARRSLFLLLGIVLVSTCLRFNQAGEIALRADEAANYYLAIKPPAAILRPLIASDPHLPLFYLLLHYWIAIAGSSELALRYLTLFSAVLVVPLVYAFGRQLFHRRDIALLAALLAAINPYSIWDSQDAYMYAMLTATGLASFIAFARLLRPDASRLTWGTYVILGTLSLYEHYLAGLLLLAQGIVWLLLALSRGINRRTIAMYLAAQAAIALLFLPWLALVFPLLAGLNESMWLPVALPQLLARAIVAFALGRIQGLGMPAMVDTFTAILGIAPFLVLLVLGTLAPLNSSRSDVKSRLMLVIYLWSPLLAFYLFTLVRFPVFDERYVLFLIPPFLLFIARGLVVLRERSRALGLGLALLVLTALTAHSLYNYWYDPAFAKSPDWRGFVRQVTEEYRPGDVLVQNYPDPALPYYLHDAVPSVLVPGRSPAAPSSVEDRMNNLTGEYSRFWFQPVAGNSWDTGGFVNTWLRRHARLVQAFPIRGLELELFTRASTALESAHASDVLFGNGVRLLGFDVDIANDSGAGSAMRVVLYWQPPTQPSRDATVFLHLYDKAGALISQSDSQPVNGSFPVHEWVPGETVVDSHLLPLAAHLATGEYQLAAGLYDSETEQRVGILDSQVSILTENRALLASLVIK